MASLPEHAHRWTRRNPCPDCGAESGEDCTTLEGDPMPWVHEGRDI